MLENEILHLEKKIARLQRHLLRLKDNSIHVTIAPIKDKVEGYKIDKVNSFLSLYFKELVYSYDTPTLVLYGESYEIWPAIQLALDTNNRVVDKVLRESLSNLIAEIRSNTLKDKTYQLA